jgi:hypothetical protein
MRPKCLQCGKPVVHQTVDGKVYVGSQWMKIHDPDYLFCRMRCAAEWALQHAKRIDKESA